MSAKQFHTSTHRAGFAGREETPMKNAILSFIRNEEGLTTVEYAVAGAVITVAVVAAFTAMGGSIAGTMAFIDGVLPG